MRRVAITIIVIALTIWSLNYLYVVCGTAYATFQAVNALARHTATREQRDAVCSYSFLARKYASTYCRATPVLDTLCSSSVRTQFEQQLSAGSDAITQSLVRRSLLLDAKGDIVHGTEKRAAAEQLASEIQQQELGMTLNTDLTLDDATLVLTRAIPVLGNRGVQPKVGTEIIIGLAVVTHDFSGYEGEQLGDSVERALLGARTPTLNYLKAAGFDPNSADKLSGDELGEYYLSHLSYLLRELQPNESKSTAPHQEPPSNRAILRDQIEIYQHPDTCRWPGHLDAR